MPESVSVVQTLSNRSNAYAQTIIFKSPGEFLLNEKRGKISRTINFAVRFRGPGR